MNIFSSGTKIFTIKWLFDFKCGFQGFINNHFQFSNNRGIFINNCKVLKQIEAEKYLTKQLD